MKIGVESSEKVGDLMTVILSYHYSGGSSEVCLLILQDPGCLGEEGAFEEERAGKLMYLVSSHMLDVCMRRGWTGSRDYFASLNLQCECALRQLMDPEGHQCSTLATSSRHSGGHGGAEVE